MLPFKKRKKTKSPNSSDLPLASLAAKIKRRYSSELISATFAEVSSEKYFLKTFLYYSTTEKNQTIQLLDMDDFHSVFLSLNV